MTDKKIKTLCIALLAVQLITGIVLIWLICNTTSDVRALNKYLDEENKAAKKASDKRVGDFKKYQREFYKSSMRM